MEAIWYPSTDAPWLEVWTVSRRRPASSRAVTKPYNYPFSDTLTETEQQAIRQRILSDPSEAVSLGAESYADTVAGLRAEDSADIWGASKDVLLYVRRQTLRVTANGYAILTRRRDVQRVERWMFANYRPPYATVRPEWSKGWGYTERGAWTNRRMIARTLPHEFRVARPRHRTWDAAVRALDRLDPHGVFTSPLLRSLPRPGVRG